MAADYKLYDCEETDGVGPFDVQRHWEAAFCFRGDRRSGPRFPAATCPSAGAEYAFNNMIERLNRKIGLKVVSSLPDRRGDRMLISARIRIKYVTANE